MKLQDIEHEISQMFVALEECEPDEREELQIKIDEYLKELKFQEADKADAIAYMFRSQNSRIEFLESEEQRIKAKRMAIESQINRSKEYFKNLMLHFGLKNISGNSSTLSLRNSQACVVNINAEYLPEEYQKVTIGENKAKIKEDLKNGIAVEGCELINNVSFNVR